MKKSFLGLIALSAVLFSCSGESKTEGSAEQKEEVKVENCYYSYDATSTEMNWTAYKFIRKAGVSGTFDVINVNGPEKSADLEAMIQKLTFEIPVNSVNSNEASRDHKIDSLFFGVMNNTAQITGRVLALKEDGTADLEVTMNEVTQTVNGKYTLNGETFTFDAEIDVFNWDGQDAINSLNEACKDLHTDVVNGDTESKLWPDVTLSFSTVFKKDCE
ncbi:YceI-like domain-containing protein [Lishizhenia tianjinensis]|uniref:YceI-like domain-containing protein n=1 Tax=Lishizhenia tianjinensis TaxID=477690 RepID=A0A1I7AXU7_9FLAO|nr:YceI family protein [Lishizhenia tianjinensis]SFT79716.1 YceI-like domain-containing protein [Lishizhenia tianjinensis]